MIFTTMVLHLASIWNRGLGANLEMAHYVVLIERCHAAAILSQEI